MSYDDDTNERDENDELFDELDAIVDLAKSEPNEKRYVGLDIAKLIAEEVHGSDIREFRQIGGEWVVEIKYKGIVFISVTGDTKFSELLPSSEE